jgi:hypothetical protein
VNDHGLFSGIPEPSCRQFKALVSYCEQHRPNVLAALPALGAELAELTSFSSMLTFVREHSGRRLHISSLRSELKGIPALKANSEAEAVDRILRLSNNDDKVEVPSSWGVFMSVRRVVIMSALYQEESDSDIAQRFGVTTRYLRKLRSSSR